VRLPAVLELRVQLPRAAAPRVSPTPPPPLHLHGLS